jgi:hypothetical protein
VSPPVGRTASPLFSPIGPAWPSFGIQASLHHWFLLAEHSKAWIAGLSEVVFSWTAILTLRGNRHSAWLARLVASAKDHARKAARPSGTRFQPIYPQILGRYLY